MALATATPVLLAYPAGFEYTQKTEVLRGTITFVDGAYNAGGLALSFSTLEPLKTAAAPFETLIWSTAPLVSNHTNYLYSFNTSTNKLQIWVVGAVSGAGLSELTPATTLPAGVLSDRVQFKTTFSKFDFFTT